MFDTHCHLNFQAFDGVVDRTITEAQANGVNHILIPSTDVPTSKKACEIVGDQENVFAAVGIHPHHIFQFQMSDSEFDLTKELGEIEKLLEDKKVVAVGEIGIDRHYYRKTKYKDYQIDEELVTLQKDVFRSQIELAKKHDKSLLLHNREAKKDFLEILDSAWDKKLEGKTVFHCCEPDEELLAYALDHKIYIGVDGDVTYSDSKKAFATKIPLKSLVLETDSPFLTPEPYRGQKNSPSNLPLIASKIAELQDVTKEEITKQTTENALALAGLV